MPHLVPRTWRALPPVSAVVQTFAFSNALFPHSMPAATCRPRTACLRHLSDKLLRSSGWSEVQRSAKYLEDAPLALLLNTLCFIPVPQLMAATSEPKVDVIPQSDSRPHPTDVTADLQKRGESVFSTTSLNGRPVLRACFVNHGTRPRHVEQAVSELEAWAERTIAA